MFKTLIRYAGLPFIFIFPLWMYAIGSATGKAPAWAMFSVVVGVFIMLFWEKYLPNRTDWRPQRQAVKVDMQYLVIVHLVFGEAMGAGIAFFLVSIFHTTAVFGSLWPHNWPVWAQVTAVVLIADVGEYWMHRMMHTVPLFWRIHKIHHAVDRLYLLASTRLHPIDVILFYLVQSLPFILFGIDPRIFGFWLVIHLMMGMTHHCNIDFRLGFLNKVFMTPDLHRWHHSIDPCEANANYATSFCFWDMVFGTYFLPNDRHVGKLGITEDFPTTFLSQLKAPFRKSKE